MPEDQTTNKNPDVGLPVSVVLETVAYEDFLKGLPPEWLDGKAIERITSIAIFRQRDPTPAPRMTIMQRLAATGCVIVLVALGIVFFTGLTVITNWFLGD